MKNKLGSLNKQTLLPFWNGEVEDQGLISSEACLLCLNLFPCMSHGALPLYVLVFQFPIVSMLVIFD